MKKAYHLAKKHLDHVYLGNAIIENTADTYCNKCGEKLIKRKAYQVKNMLENNKCPECGTELYGELPMTFRKNPGQVMGLITATINGEARKYVFNDKGYEPLEDLIDLAEE